MKRVGFLFNKQGMTLVEVLAAIIILAIIFISFFGFFINSSKHNAINDKNITSTSLAREYAAKFDIDYNRKPWSEVRADFQKDPARPGYMKKSVKEDQYFIEYVIREQKEAGQHYADLRQVRIQIWQGDQTANPYSETFLYHEAVKGS